jgi:hypothetical protein
MGSAIDGEDIGSEVIAVFEDRADPKPSYICGSSGATIRSLTSMTTAMGFDVDRATAGGS